MEMTKAEHRLRLEVEVVARGLKDLPDFYSVCLMLERALLETKHEHIYARRRCIAECGSCGFEAKIAAAPIIVQCPMCEGSLVPIGHPVHEVPDDFKGRTVDLGLGMTWVL